jgi:hypothetical protein
METILHAYHPKRSLMLLEYARTSEKGTTNSSPASAQNVLLFVGGMFDNFRWPRYLDDLAALFPCDVPNQNWRVMQVQLSSNGRSWGIFSLDRDVSCVIAMSLRAWPPRQSFLGIENRPIPKHHRGLRG